MIAQPSSFCFAPICH